MADKLTEEERGRVESFKRGNDGFVQTLDPEGKRLHTLDQALAMVQGKSLEDAGGEADEENAKLRRDLSNLKGRVTKLENTVGGEPPEDTDETKGNE